MDGSPWIHPIIIFKILKCILNDLFDGKSMELLSLIVQRILNVNFFRPVS
jgi:hypothetical protein